MGPGARDLLPRLRLAGSFGPLASLTDASRSFRGPRSQGGRSFVHRLAGRAGDDERVLALFMAWFWYERANLDVAIRRGHLWTAHYHLERCRERCLDLAWVRARPEIWPGGHEKAERIVGAEILERLAPTIVPLEPAAIRMAAESVTDLYRELGAEAAAAFGVEYPTGLDETILRA